MEISISDERFERKPVSHVVDLTGEFPSRRAFHQARWMRHALGVPRELALLPSYRLTHRAESLPRRITTPVFFPRHRA